jgi:hypothetical protein
LSPGAPQGAGVFFNAGFGAFGVKRTSTSRQPQLNPVENDPKETPQVNPR